MLESLYNRVKIGGKLSHAHTIILLKDMIRRVDALEAKSNEFTVSGAGNSKAPKKKAAAKRVSGKSDSDS